MRLIGYLPNESHANTFSEYLLVEGITNEIERETEAWALWIHSEDECDKAKELLGAFLKDPENETYARKAKQAQALKTKAAAEEEAAAKRFHDRTQVFRASMPYGAGPLAIVLIVVSTLVHLMKVGGFEDNVLRELYITAIQTDGIEVMWKTGLPELRNGEFWRLFTPAIVHGSLLHLFMNMYWLFILGSMVEGRQSTARLGALILVIAALSNLAQATLVGPYFCGMSGVTYGLLGYVWIKGKLDPSSGLFLHPQVFLLMMIWFFLCLFKVIPHIANAAHGVGLAVGTLWGFLASLHVIRRQR